MMRVVRSLLEWCVDVLRLVCRDRSISRGEMIVSLCVNTITFFY
jgi:hypothetical protein